MDGVGVLDEAALKRALTPADDMRKFGGDWEAMSDTHLMPV